MSRDLLDLRGKTMSELQEMDSETGKVLDRLKCFNHPTFGEVIRSLLADRRQIRQSMEELTHPTEVTGEITWEPGPAQAKALEMLDDGTFWD